MLLLYRLFSFLQLEKCSRENELAIEAAQQRAHKNGAHSIFTEGTRAIACEAGAAIM